MKAYSIPRRIGGAIQSSLAVVRMGAARPGQQQRDERREHRQPAGPRDPPSAAGSR
ncbi:hypothetical protein ACFSTC_49455 [Nonomuraea ferruginea]